MRRVFAIPFFVVMGVVLVVAWTRYAQSGAWPWLGPLVVSAGFLAWFAFVLLRRAPRTAKRPPLLILTMLTGVGVAAWAAWDDLGSEPLVWSLGLATLELVYLLWYSPLQRTHSPHISVGALLPEFEAEEGGTRVSSLQLRGVPAVFLFFRGNWCPLCVAQVREMATEYRKLAALGAEVILVSGQSREKTESLAQRFDVPFRYWVDVDLAAATSLGILDRGGTPLGLEFVGYDPDTVLPTVLVVDASGTIVLSDQTDNYRVRPEPATFIAALSGETHVAERRRGEPERRAGLASEGA